MFPLGTVLVPYGVLPLHVFEQRYRALVHDVLAADRRFGVVLIERGSEVGGGDQRFGCGTVAEIIDAARTADGRWALMAVGTARLVVEGWLAEDPYPTAEVHLLEEGPGQPDDALLAEAEAQVRRLIALHHRGAGLPPPPPWERVPDPVAAGWQMAGVAPLEAIDRQRVLSTDDPIERVRLLGQLAGERAELLELERGHP